MSEEHKELLFELRSIKRTLNIAHSQQIDTYLNDIIKSENRRKMWIAIDGEKMSNEIAEEANVTPMAVSNFLKLVSELSLVQYRQGNPPKKIIDHIPAEWVKENNE